MPDSLQGIGEALIHEDLKPSAPWGLTVYRTAYGDDAPWGRLRDALSGDGGRPRPSSCTAAQTPCFPRLSTAFIEE